MIECFDSDHIIIITIHTTLFTQFLESSNDEIRRSAVNKIHMVGGEV